MNTAGPAAIQIQGRNATMVHVARREPRQYVDFSAVPPSQWKMHDRLENWARWCRPTPEREGKAGAPMFSLYRSSEARSREYGAATSVPVDRIDAQFVHKGVLALPDKHRRALDWCYLHPYAPASMARELGLTLAGMAQMILDARQMLINRKV